MKCLTRLTAAAVSAIVMLGLAASASAAPAAGYEEFSDCPSRAVVPTISFCTASVVHDGHFKMGSKTVPIVDPITAQGALTPGGTFIPGSFHGGRQLVPGGIIGITGLDWLINLFPGNLLKLYAETELAGVPTNPNAANVTLPIRVKLENPLLSDTCYVGGFTNPITLHLTTGTTSPPPPNTPITGAPGTLVQPAPGGPLISRIDERILVDNAFAAPAATGCDMLLPGLGLVNALVNYQAGLPAAAGTNETVQVADGALSPVVRVYPPAGIETTP